MLEIGKFVALIKCCKKYFYIEKGVNFARAWQRMLNPYQNQSTLRYFGCLDNKKIRREGSENRWSFSGDYRPAVTSYILKGGVESGFK